MSKIQIGKRSTKATEFIEGNNIFMNSEGNFVASEFVEIDTPNISKMYKSDKHFETFEIIESEESPSPGPSPEPTGSLDPDEIVPGAIDLHLPSGKLWGTGSLII